jgi:hypothetical protein
MSDNVDYSFMRSGFDNLETQDETIENVGSVVMTFMENAMKSADIYVKHAKRNSITPEDVKRGLMLEVFLMKNRPNMLERCEAMKARIKDIIRDEEENGEEIVIGEEPEEPEEDEPFTVSTCRCAICNCFNTIYTRWEGFTPQLPMEKILVKSINAIHAET